MGYRPSEIARVRWVSFRLATGLPLLRFECGAEESCSGSAPCAIDATARALLLERWLRQQGWWTRAAGG